MAKAKVVSFGLRSKVFFSLISRDFHDLFFFLRNFLSTAWRVNRLQLPATEQVMIIICFACSNCRWNWVSEVEERLRFSGFQFIIFIAHMFQRRRQIELNWIKLYLLRNKKIFMFSAVCRAKKKSHNFLLHWHLTNIAKVLHQKFRHELVVTFPFHFLLESDLRDETTQEWSIEPYQCFK